MRWRWLVVREHVGIRCTSVVATCRTRVGARVAVWWDKRSGRWPSVHHEWEILRRGGERLPRHAR